MEMIKRILVADTGVEFRRGLIRALAEDTGLQVVGETGDGAERSEEHTSELQSH